MCNINLSFLLSMDVSQKPNHVNLWCSLLCVFVFSFMLSLLLLLLLLFLKSFFLKYSIFLQSIFCGSTISILGVSHNNLVIEFPLLQQLLLQKGTMSLHQ